jgi:mono/diheme cytochrome c family protein
MDRGCTTRATASKESATEKSEIWESKILDRAGALAVLGTGFAILASLAVAGCHSAPALTPQQAEGKHLYDSRCAHCHELNDLALKKVPPNLHGVFDSPKLPSGAPATDVNVERTVLSGKNMMPSFAGRFTQGQMAALLAYLHAGIRSE